MVFSLLGNIIGDALGAPYEFILYKEIIKEKHEGVIKFPTSE